MGARARILEAAACTLVVLGATTVGVLAPRADALPRNCAEFPDACLPAGPDPEPEPDGPPPPPLEEVVGNPGPVTFGSDWAVVTVGARQLRVDAERPLTMPAKVDAFGNLSIAAGAVTFPSESIDVLGRTITVSVTNEAPGRGHIDPTRTTFTLDVPLTVRIGGLLGADDCHVGPTGVHLTSGQSGNLTGLGYNFKGEAVLVASGVALPGSSDCGVWSDLVDGQVSGSASFVIFVDSDPVLRPPARLTLDQPWQFDIAGVAGMQESAG